MLDGLNAVFDAFGYMWTAIFDAPLYGELTWGYFAISACIMSILISFFVDRFK